MTYRRDFVNKTYSEKLKIQSKPSVTGTC